MSTKNITLAQLQLALARIKAYDEGKYSQLGHTHPSSDVISLAGFVASAEGDSKNMRIALSESDTLNAALAKLDRSIANITDNIGAIDVENHKHDDIYYQKTEIDAMVDTLEKADEENLTEAKTYTETYTNTAIANLVDSAPETLNTLNELAAALGDDPSFATTVSDAIGQRVIGPQTAVIGNVAIFNATNGKSIECSEFAINKTVPADALFTDHNVLTAPNVSAAIYFAGTTNAAGETNTLAINPNFYIDGGAEKIVAPNFEGHLAGKADTAGTADTALKTQAALTIKFNDTVAGTFDGSAAKEIVITPEAINAHDQEYTEKAADSEVEAMLNSLFGAE